VTRWSAISWLDEIKHRYIHGGDEDFDGRRREALDMAIAALREQPLWISVEERLPETWVEVLAFVPGVGYEVAWFCGAENSWRWAWTGESVTLVVTHWMPLPEAPEVEG